MLEHHKGLGLQGVQQTLQHASTTLNLLLTMPLLKKKKNPPFFFSIMQQFWIFVAAPGAAERVRCYTELSSKTESEAFVTQKKRSLVFVILSSDE